MQLAAGSRLSFHEVLAPLGAGAMGEVSRARDTRLGREVAIKVLPEHFAIDEERLRRFEREAQVLATVKHPNVAQIFGVDQVGDTCFLVLELVPGQNLDERSKRGPLSLEDALEICLQIAQGLEAAHEAGVIHRDWARGARGSRSSSARAVLGRDEASEISSRPQLQPHETRETPAELGTHSHRFNLVHGIGLHTPPEMRA